LAIAWKVLTWSKRLCKLKAKVCRILTSNGSHNYNGAREEQVEADAATAGLQNGISAVASRIGLDVSIVASVDSYGKVDYLECSARAVQRNCSLSK